jgi:hypothetical protein
MFCRTVFVFYSPGDVHFIYDDSAQYSQIQFRFVILVSLESEIIGVNTTSVPMDTLNEHIPPNEKLWRETIINPTAMSRKKTIKEVFQVTEQITITEDYTHSTMIIATQVKAVEVPGGNALLTQPNPLPPLPLPMKTITRSHIAVKPNIGTIYANGEHDLTETVRTVEVLETIIIPSFTCIEAFLIIGAEKALQQNMTAHLRVSGKVNRFDSVTGIIRYSKWAPGFVVEQVMKEKNFTGNYVDTRAGDVSYEITGKLETSQGIHSSFIAHEIDCPNTNKNS